MPTELEREVRPEQTESLRSRLDLLIPLGTTISMVVFVAYASIRPLLFGKPWMLFFEDDFFYYLKVAQNLAHGSGSTFNGIVPTNGYHPLWFLMLTALSLISSRPQAIVGFVALILFVSTLAIYFLTQRLLACYGVNRVMSCALAAYATTYSMRIMFGGMEIVLAIPLLLLVVLLARSPTLLERGWQGFAWLGLACSAMILARLDTALLAGLMLLTALAYSELRRRVTRGHVMGMALGLLPVLIYLAVNITVFGVLLPVSGSAKQLKVNYLPTSPAWTSVFHRPLSQLLNFVPIVAAIALVPVLRKRFTALDKAVILPVLIFPFFYVAVLSCRSDWQLWGWYLYPFRAAFCVSLAVVVAVPAISWLLQRRWVMVAIAMIAFMRLVLSSWGTGGRDEIYATAVELQQFARTHPGVYAMGDRSGMPAYLLPYPVIQMEGLVMDRHFLDSIRRSEPIRSVLGHYGVRYYVGTSHEPPKGCFEAYEPANAGPSSPHMRGEFCETPVATYRHGDWYTLVYDVGAPVADGRLPAGTP